MFSKGKIPQGAIESQLDPWSTHLAATLDQEDTRNSDAVWRTLRDSWDEFVITACRTQANRHYFIQCKRCSEFAWDEYGHGCSDEQKKKSMFTLLNFLGHAENEFMAAKPVV